jgi:hypothetical protein
VFLDGEAAQNDHAAEYQARIDSGALVIGVVISEAEDDKTIQREITRLEAGPPLLPGRLGGIVGRYQPTRLYEFGTVFTVATVLNGPGSIIVQPDFYRRDWYPGELVYMEMQPPDDPELPRYLQRFNIQYVCEEEMMTRRCNDGTSYTVVGTYIERDAHPDFYCARMALSDCCSATFWPDPTP